MSIKCARNFSGYVFTLSDLGGSQRFAIRLKNEESSSKLWVEISKIGQLQWTRSFEFDLPGDRSSWQQFAISVADDSLQLHYDCDRVIRKDFQGAELRTLNANLMMSIGPYFTKYGSSFEGAIEQLVIVDDVISANQQCSSVNKDPVGMIPDEHLSSL